MLHKESIKDNFSRHAKCYDDASEFQNEMGRRLLDMAALDNGLKCAVLDIGMGSGKLTQELAGRLKRAPVFGCDIAWGMAAFSKRNTNGIFVMQAEAETLPFKKGAFGLVFSNVVYQWVSDYKKAFLEVRRVLKEGGRFYFSILVKGSLGELYQTLDAYVEKGLTGFLPSRETINQDLRQAGLEVVWLETLSFKKYYKSCLELLGALKRSGAGQITESHIFGMGKKNLFFKMLNEYDTNFCERGNVYATYNVIFGCAVNRRGRGPLSARSGTAPYHYG